MVSFGLVQEGWDNLTGLFSGKKSAKDILPPSKADIFGQIRKASDPRPAIVGGAGEIIKKTPEVVVKAVAGNKYLKYAAIGGAALIGLALLRRR